MRVEAWDMLVTVGHVFRLFLNLFFFLFFGTVIFFSVYKRRWLAQWPRGTCNFSHFRGSRLYIYIYILVGRAPHSWSNVKNRWIMTTYRGRWVETSSESRKMVVRLLWHPWYRPPPSPWYFISISIFWTTMVLMAPIAVSLELCRWDLSIDILFRYVQSYSRAENYRGGDDIKGCYGNYSICLRKSEYAIQKCFQEFFFIFVNSSKPHAQTMPQLDPRLYRSSQISGGGGASKGYQPTCHG